VSLCSRSIPLSLVALNDLIQFGLVGVAVLLGNSVLQILVGLIVGVEQSLVSVGVGILLQSSDAANSSSQVSSLGIVSTELLTAFVTPTSKMKRCWPIKRGEILY